MQKKFGQNFLISPTFQNSICKESLKNIECDEVWEVGPGFGAITHKFVELGKSVKVFEIDNGFINILRQGFNNNEINIVKGDVLKTIFQQVKCPSLLIGNLPYNIGTPLIIEIIKMGIGGTIPSKMVFLLQKECALKFVAPEASKEYNPLAFSANLFFDVKIAFNIGRGAFFPSPLVESSLLVFNKKNNSNFNIQKSTKLIDFAKSLFSNPRKTIYNNLLKVFSKEIIDKNITKNPKLCNLLSLRPAQLMAINIIDFFEIFNF